MISRNKSILAPRPQVDSTVCLVLVLVLATDLRLNRLAANSLWFDQTVTLLITH